MTACLLVSVMADAVPRVESKACVRHRGRDCVDPFPWAALIYGCIALTAMLVLVIGKRGHHTVAFSNSQGFSESTQLQCSFTRHYKAG